jgi:hypothetical protein
MSEGCEMKGIQFELDQSRAELITDALSLDPTLCNANFPNVLVTNLIDSSKDYSGDRIRGLLSTMEEAKLVIFTASPNDIKRILTSEEMQRVEVLSGFSNVTDIQNFFRRFITES